MLDGLRTWAPHYSVAKARKPADRLRHRQPRAVSTSNTAASGDKVIRLDRVTKKKDLEP